MKQDTIILTGTRPDIIKLYPLIKDTDSFVCHSGQHAELAIKQFDALNITPDISFTRSTESLNNLTVEIIEKLEQLSITAKRIIIHGDTQTALAGALWGFNRQIEVVHVEAGLRSHDVCNPFPEEMNRQVIDRLSTYKFAPSYLAFQNLLDEKLNENAIMSGNTLIDSLNMLSDRILENSPVDTKYIVWTTHRRENLSELTTIFSALRDVQKKYVVVFPIHLNPLIKKIADDVGIQYVESFDYITFLSYLKHCSLIVTDSGGLQEEAVYFNKPILILRKTTERPELLTTSYALLSEINKFEILEKIDYLFDKQAKYYPFYGVGQAVNKIKTILSI
jgi:UDP-N-acetylglucosamine 2-epimerase (non-hydrolysing)